MAFVTFMEIIDVIIMSLVIGYIFKDIFRAPTHMGHDPLAHYRRHSTRIKNFFSEDFKFAVIVTAPAIILHELGHKLVAMSMGYSAVFHAAYMWLGLGILLKLISAGFIFFVPAYVAIYGAMTPLQHSLIAFAGPGVNLLLFLISMALLNNRNFVQRSKKWVPAIYLMKKINMFLFIFNMIPIPGFDGYQVFKGLLATVGFF